VTAERRAGGRTGRGGPRGESKQKTRAALLRAALELFAEQGLDLPSLDAICDRAGFTRGAFYVHFRDRDDLLVAAMDKVGEAFLASVFEQAAEASREPVDRPPKAAGASPADAKRPKRARRERGTRTEASQLAAVIDRFTASVIAGSYPLIPARSPKAAASSEGGANQGLHVRPHQLLDACARSSVVRERYRGLVEASVAHVARIAESDRTRGAIRRDVDVEAIGKLLLSIVIGAQTMAELGVAMDPTMLARTVAALLSPKPPSASTT
jgi:TetR/AcrR family transcriptional regulator, transcriptional repressor for nem operon